MLTSDAAFKCTGTLMYLLKINHQYWKLCIGTGSNVLDWNKLKSLTNIGYWASMLESMSRGTSLLVIENKAWEYEVIHLLKSLIVDILVAGISNVNITVNLILLTQWYLYKFPCTLTVVDSDWPVQVNHNLNTHDNDKYAVWWQEKKNILLLIDVPMDLFFT